MDFTKEVRKRLIEMDKNQTWLAEQLGFSRQHINNVLVGLYRSERTRREIEKLLWPDK